MGCSGSKETGPPCTCFWETKGFESLDLRTEGETLTNVMSLWGKHELDGQAAKTRIADEVVKSGRGGAAMAAVAAGAKAGAVGAAGAVEETMQKAAIQGTEAAGQVAPVAGTVGVGGMIGQAVGGIIGGAVGGFSAGMGSQKIFDHMDLLLVHSSREEARKHALKHLSCLESADFKAVKNAFIEMGKAQHPDNGGNREDFLALCIAVEVIRHTKRQ